MSRVSEDDESDFESEDNYPGRYVDTRSFTPADKRAHHNALERKRRDHIKDRFNGLKESIPSIRHEKSVSRAQILKKAAEYIQQMKNQYSNYSEEIETLKKQNALLESQCEKIESQRFSRNRPNIHD